jgi:anaerobic selenocysteine-containing dehydrogenase
MKVKTVVPSGVVPTLCRMCETRCAINVHIKNKVLTDITPFEGHPVNQGKICPRGGAALDLFYHMDRILAPLKRQQNGSFKEIPYEQALDEIAAKLASLKKQFGARSVGVWKGEGLGFHQQEGYVRRFVHGFGSPNYFSNDSACYNGRYLGNHLVCGFWNPFPEFDRAKLIILLGTNPPICHPPFMRELADARSKGAKLVMIDPRLNPVACYADIFAQPYPGTDGALAWGLIRYLIRTHNYDSDLVDRYAIGFDKIAAYAEKFTPEYVARQSGIYDSVVEEIAQLIIKNRPRISIYPGAGLEHHENGVNSIRVLTILSCLCGALGQPCGIFRPQPLGIRDLVPGDDPPAVDLGPIGADKFPVLYDIRRECHSMTAMDYMLGKGAYPLKGMIVAAANPAVSNPNTRKVEQALAGLDLLVVNDFFMTRTARLAHFILPAATFLEREELHFFPTRQRVNITRNVARVEGVRTEFRVWRDLAHRLGFGDTLFPWKSEAEVNRWLLEPTGLTVKKLRRYPQGYVYQPVDYRKFLSEPLPTPSGKLEFASPYLQRLGLSEVPEYHQPAYRQQPDENYPFVMTTGARKSLIYHSRHQNIQRFRDVHPHAEMEIHPADAADLGISDGERVRVVSRVGELVIRAAVKHAAELRQGVVEIYHGWEDWRVNFLTPDDINDPISGFPLLKAVPVRVEKIGPVG